MWPGMRPATGWIAYLTSTPFSSSSSASCADVVLRLRDRHPVAGHDDDLARERELHGDVLGRRRAHGAPVVGAHRRSGARLHLPEGAEEDVRDGAVHRLRHQQRQHRAGGADEHPGDDQDGVREHEAGRRGGEAGEGVEQRDHDRHVGAADRQHEQDAEEERERRRAATAPTGRATPATSAMPSPTAARKHGGVEDVLAGERDRPAADAAPAASRRRSSSRRTRSSRSAPRARSTPIAVVVEARRSRCGTPPARRAPRHRRRPR